MEMKFHVLQQLHAKDALELVVDAFLDRQEPVIHIFQDNRDIFRQYIQNEIRETIENGLSAVVMNSNNEMIGVCLNKDYYATTSKWKQDFYADLKKKNEYYYFDFLHKLLDKLYYNSNVDNKIMGSCGKDCIGVIGNVYYISYIASSRFHTHQGISTKLLKYCLQQIAVGKGYKFAISECTNDWSCKCFVKNGFKSINAIKYRDFEYPIKSNEYPIREVSAKFNAPQMYLVIKPVSKITAKL